MRFKRYFKQLKKHLDSLNSQEYSKSKSLQYPYRAPQGSGRAMPDVVEVQDDSDSEGSFSSAESLLATESEEEVNERHREEEDDNVDHMTGKAYGRGRVSAEHFTELRRRKSMVPNPIGALGPPKKKEFIPRFVGTEWGLRKSNTAQVDITLFSLSFNFSLNNRCFYRLKARKNGIYQMSGQKKLA